MPHQWTTLFSHIPGLARQVECPWQSLIYYHKSQESTGTTTETNTIATFKHKPSKKYNYYQEDRHPYKNSFNTDQNPLKTYLLYSLDHWVQGWCLAYSSICSKNHYSNHLTVSSWSDTEDTDLEDAEYSYNWPSWHRKRLFQCQNISNSCLQKDFICFSHTDSPDTEKSQGNTKV